jgi:hypothetical protein
VNCVFLFDDAVEDGGRETKRGSVGGSSMFSAAIQPTGKRVRSSLAAPGINILSAVPATIARRPLTEFVYTTDELPPSPT